ncbi:MAG TPA: GNAT family N-acetyltransferase [Hyphomicrobiales bacterium]|nr:GNAT family N-acetyltransferase [Hyphomicrobiales bacterium]
MAAASQPGLVPFDSIAAATPFWQALQEGGVTTPFQRLDWIAAWCRHASPALGETPLFVGLAGERGEPALLFPFGVVRQNGLRVARWLGGDHANFNLGLIGPSPAAAMAPAAMQRLLRDAGQRAGVDVFLLERMPRRWDGISHPLATLPGTFPSVDQGFRGPLGPDGEAVIQSRYSSASRRTVRKKEQRLAEHGEIRIVHARTPAEAGRLLDAYLAEKAKWFRERGIDDPFAAPGVHDFLLAAALAGMSAGHPAIDLYGYEVGGRLLAVTGGAAHAGRFSMMFTGIADDELTRFSPGEQLSLAVVADLCARGFHTVDFGVGDTAYKHRLCPEEETLFDVAVAVSAKGRAAAAAWTGLRRLRREAKRSPRIRAAVERLRRLKARASGAKGGED